MINRLFVFSIGLAAWTG